MNKKKITTPLKKNTSSQGSILPSGYSEFLIDLKRRVRSAQVKAVVSVNSEMIQLYWDIGKAILINQAELGWGSKVIEQLGIDLKKEFPSQSGFSLRNLKYMRAFAEAWPDFAIVQQAAAQIPWFHNVVLIEQVKNHEARLWYAKATKEHGWSRAVLEHQIETDLFSRKGKAVSNFQRTLPASSSDLALETLKDPYTFAFLNLAENHAEAELETGLIHHIQKFLLELGVGFTFVGSQYHLEVGGDDFYLDLLFYHLKLRAFVIFDLKAKAFTPEAVGKMNFYCTAIDEILRHETDHKTIGIILCKSKNNLVAEYSLRDIDKPLAITTYITKLLESIPASMIQEHEKTDEKKVDDNLPAKKSTKNSKSQ